MKPDKFRSSVFLYLFFLLSFNNTAQKVFDAGASYLYGLNINKASDRKFGQTIPSGIEINFHRYRDGSKYWQKLFNYPQTGWSLTWLDHRNEILGNSFVLNRYLNYVFLRRRSFNAYLKLSQGIMYADKIYEAGTNSKDKFNNAVSQNLNFSEDLGFGFSFYPAKHFGINFSATCFHFSNGAISQPNDGLNLMMFGLGAIYVIGEKETMELKYPEPTADDRSIKYNITAGTGIKQLSPENKEKYNVTAFSFYADKKLSRIGAVNLGIDVFLDQSVKYSIENDNTYKGKDYKRIGISIGHEFFIDQVGILTQVGYDVYSPYPALVPFYQKFGFKYYITDLFFITFTDKIFRFGISDEMTWGVGARL